MDYYILLIIDFKFINMCAWQQFLHFHACKGLYDFFVLSVCNFWSSHNVKNNPLCSQNA